MIADTTRERTTFDEAAVMPFVLSPRDGEMTILAVGAHCDDIEIGVGGTLLRLVAEVPAVRAHVLVLSSTPARAAEARSSASAFLAGGEVTTQVMSLPDGRLPAFWEQVKDALEDAASSFEPDLIFAPSRNDAHQDHRTVGELVRTAFRDHVILHYEIPKWDGDLGEDRRSHYVALDDATITRKCELLRQHFPSQTGRDWFNDDTFLALARLRGIECRAPFAEAFTVDKALLTPALLRPT